MSLTSYRAAPSRDQQETTFTSAMYRDLYRRFRLKRSYLGMIPFSKRNASYDNLTIEGAVFCGSIVLEAFIVSYSHKRNVIECWRLKTYG